MKTRAAGLLLVLGLDPALAPAEEYLGAARTLARVTAETAAKAADIKDRALRAWQAKARATAEAMPALAPADAAARWLALADEWRALPSEAVVTSEGREVFQALWEALPPPSAWEAFDAAIAARAAEGEPLDLACAC